MYFGNLTAPPLGKRRMPTSQGCEESPEEQTWEINSVSSIILHRCEVAYSGSRGTGPDCQVVGRSKQAKLTKLLEMLYREGVWISKTEAIRCPVSCQNYIESIPPSLQWIYLICSCHNTVTCAPDKGLCHPADTLNQWQLKKKKKSIHPNRGN